LEEVSPDGRVTYLTEGELRALHRKVSADPPPYVQFGPYHSFRRADGQPAQPGEVLEMAFALHPTSVVVRSGHRLRVALAGADADTFARVPDKGAPVLEIQRNAAFGSHIDIPVMRR